MEVILVIAQRELVCLWGVVARYAHVPKRLDHIIHSIIVGRRKTEHTGTSPVLAIIIAVMPFNERPGNTCFLYSEYRTATAGCQ